MGILSITRRIPELTLTFYERINSIFAPPWTKLYAEGNTKELHSGIISSLRFFGIISIIPTAFIFVFSDHFYQLWMPTQDAHLLYILTVGACVDLPIAMPLQPIYNIYPIVNKIRANSLFGLGLFSLTFVVVVIGLNVTEGETTHLMIIACTSAVFNAIKALTLRRACFTPAQYVASSHLPSRSPRCSISSSSSRTRAGHYSAPADSPVAWWEAHSVT